MRVARFIAVLLPFLMINIMSNKVCYATDTRRCSSSCGDIFNITSPFRLTTDPLHCGDLRYNLSCENNITTLHFYVAGWLLTGLKTYIVQAINYNNYTIRVVDPNVHKNNFSSVPSNTLSFEAFLPNQYEGEIRHGLVKQDPYQYPSASFKYTRKLFQTIIFFTCEKLLHSSGYIESPRTFNGACSSGTPSSQAKRQYSYYYVRDGGSNTITNVEESCCVDQISVIGKGEIDYSNAKSGHDIHNALLRGFEISWVQSFDKTGSRLCYVDDKDPTKVRCFSGCSTWDPRVSTRGCSHFERFIAYLELYLYVHGGYKFIVGVLTPRTVAGVTFLIWFFIYKWRRRHLSMYEDIEKFFRSQKNVAPIRYSYSDIKKMTKGFQDKLGEGGFGSVYKGKLRSGGFVAIKMLGKSKGTNWQDFINEVATIGTIHHVNVVRLIGFCVEGSKRALIYDFMSNGSLDKYIFLKEGTNDSLSSKKIFEISLGVARGIEYLHRGCNMRILHFDIKPHNILLDENFIPKVSDFGLARLSPLDHSIISLTAARGTMGYIAPELFYKNIGGVSCKADVYSFGMLLMEMANKRKNLNANAENSSQIYFPLWIYDQVSRGNDIEIEHNATVEESKIVKKMIIVALWCIQLKPADRPSMNEVIEMLEGGVESLQMPPRPCLYPQEQEQQKHKVEDDVETSSSSTLS